MPSTKYLPHLPIYRAFIGGTMTLWYNWIRGPLVLVGGKSRMNESNIIWKMDLHLGEGIFVYGMVEVEANG